jgi:hypothetical protein
MTTTMKKINSVRKGGIATSYRDNNKLCLAKAKPREVCTLEKRYGADPNRRATNDLFKSSWHVLVCLCVFLLSSLIQQ